MFYFRGISSGLGLFVWFGVVWCGWQAINRIPESIKTLQIGNDVTRGLGAGGVPDIGKRAAEESRADIAEVCVVHGTCRIHVCVH